MFCKSGIVKRPIYWTPKITIKNYTRWIPKSTHESLKKSEFRYGSFEKEIKLELPQKFIGFEKLKCQTTI